MDRDEKATRKDTNRKRERARAERAERAAVATRAWQASGKAPAMKGRKAAAGGDDVLTRAEVAAMLAACGKSTTGIRNAAMLAVLYGTAMRISEAVGLYPADLNLANDAEGALAGSLFIRARKGGKHDTIGISAAMVPYLVAWTERRASLGVNGHDPYFCAVSGASLGNPTNPSYWRHLLPKLGARADIEGKRVHPHGLRRTAATHMRDAGFPLDVIQRQLGHKNLATTQIYLGQRADADHLRMVSDFAAEVHESAPAVSGASGGATRAQAAAPAAPPSLAVLDLATQAAVRYAQLPAEVRETVTADAYIAGTINAWTAAGV